MTLKIKDFPAPAAAYADYIKQAGVVTIDELLKRNIEQQFSPESPKHIQRRVVLGYVFNLVECEVVEYDDYTETVRWINGQR